MMKLAYSIALLSLCVILLPEARSPSQLSSDTKVAEVLHRLGDTVASEHLPRLSVEGVSVEAGKQLVMNGQAEQPGGGMSSRISKHFVCTSCHNTQREDPDLTSLEPEARLAYAMDKNIPFLPATTFFGISNRETYYNGDYIEKYGEELVGKARHSLRASIQLCATECSQGRYLEPWEVESIVAYYWTLGFEMKDLQWRKGDWNILERALEEKRETEEAIELIKSKYMTYSPADFIDPPENRRKGNPHTGDAEKGRAIYIKSCMHCHENERYSMLNLDTTRFSLHFLDRHVTEYDRYSIYQVVRYGTSPKYGKRAYMPHYTLQRMSRKQIEDLRAYIEQGPDLSS